MRYKTNNTSTHSAVSTAPDAQAKDCWFFTPPLRILRKEIRILIHVT